MSWLFGKVSSAMSSWWFSVCLKKVSRFLHFDENSVYFRCALCFIKE